MTPARRTGHPGPVAIAGLASATARRMGADLTTSQRFRRSWWTRLRRRGRPAMARLHGVGDGASWLWKAAARALSGCRQTLEISHASQPIAAASAFPEQGRAWLLPEGGAGVCRLIGEALTREDTPPGRASRERLRKDFVTHLSRLDSAGRRASGEVIGSGVVEGAAKTLGLRLKRRGAGWKPKNARAMAALICCRPTDQWDLFWSRSA